MSKKIISFTLIASLATFILGVTVSAQGATSSNTETLITTACKALSAENYALAHTTLKKLSAIDSGFSKYAEATAMYMSQGGTLMHSTLNEDMSAKNFC